MAGDEGKCPLKGVRVLDPTRVVMGPWTTQIFADPGADIVKVEAPAGDVNRHLPPGPDPTHCAMFMNLNRGKRCIVFDLKQQQAHEGAAAAGPAGRGDEPG